MKREREKHITRLHIILFSIIVIAAVTTVIVVKTGGSRKIQRYKKLEKDLNTATIYYFGNKELELEKGRIKVIKMDTLIKNGYLQDEITSKCKGYTIVSNARQIDGSYEIGYNSYIKCGDSYKTIGFEDNILNQ
jgi:hypothetical protein